MKPVTVGRYKPGETMPGEAQVVTGGSPGYGNGHDWLGWVETEDWILFENENGTITVFNGRTESGAVKGPAVVVFPQESPGHTLLPIVVQSDGSLAPA